MPPKFVHLNLHTNYSLLSGASRIEENICRAKELGFDALAITDTNALYGAMEFYRKAREAGIRPILGAEVETDSARAVCLARDRDGYASLCRIVTERHLAEKFDLTETLVRNQRGLFILTGSPALLARLDGRIDRGSLFRELNRFNEERRGRGKACLAPTDAANAHGSDGVLPFAHIPPVATNGVHFVHPDRYELHRILTAIRKNKLLVEVALSEVAHPESWLKGTVQMEALFSDTEGRRAMANAARIADGCRLEIQTGRPIFPSFFTLTHIPPEVAGLTPPAALRKLALEGVNDRYRPGSAAVVQRLNYELGIIETLGFSEYFLIVWDIVNFARRSDIPIVGRGSAANSLVAYALGITRADPISNRLPFERFMNLSRSDCPDIDLDMCWRRRDEVLKYVYDRHGADCVAMVSNHNTFQMRSAFRDVARVFGLALPEINRLCAKLPSYSAGSIRESIATLPEARDFPIDREPYRTIAAHAEALDGFPRHLGIHIGGIVIGDKPLTNYLPLERAAKGLVISQYEMHGVEAIGLVKIDLLGHRSLTVIRDTVDALEKRSGTRLDLETIPDADPLTAAMLREGRTIGCFQIESPGMRSLLKMIRAGNRLDVIHALSLIRPGPSASGMKERFIRRRLGAEAVSYPHSSLTKVLDTTYGVMLFQEDILKVAAAVAGFSLEDGDALRLAISRKRSPERMAALRDRFMQGAIARRVSPQATGEIWEAIQNFAGYSYCKAHAVTYGYLSYQAAFLKAHHPAEFMTAMMANQGGFYEMREYLEEARRLGVKILHPDVNCSEVNPIGRGELNDSPGIIRIGLRQVKGISQRAVASILRARAKRPFSGLEDFYFRTQINDSEAEALILCGALGGFGRTRPQLLWELRRLSNDVRRSFQGEMAAGLFADAPGEKLDAPREMPDLPEYPVEKRIELEQKILGLAVSDHPMRMFTREMERRDVVPTNQLDRNVGRRVTVAGWLVTTRRAVTKDQQYMKFLTLEDRFGTVEVILFPEAYRQFGHLIRSYGPYLVRGKVELNHRAIGLTADWLALGN